MTFNTFAYFSGPHGTLRATVERLSAGKIFLIVKAGVTFATIPKPLARASVRTLIYDVRADSLAHEE